MLKLDALDAIKALDKANMLSSIRMLAHQVSDAWEKFPSATIPESFKEAKNVIIAGMGGSALGGRIIDALIIDRARVPIEVFTEYHIPGYVGTDTLVVVSSYSGNTEETLKDLDEATGKKAMVFGITTGGKLAARIKEEHIPGFVFDPLYNPSNQPRMALGYSIASILALLFHSGLMAVTNEELQEIGDSIKDFILEFDPETPEKDNLAKMLARKLHGKIPVLIASEHMIGSSHAMKNQLNENSKTFSFIFDIPELNHHLMEGLRNPAPAKQYLHFLFVESALYSPLVRKRYPITREVVGKNEVELDIYKLRSAKKHLQIFELLVLGSYISFYLAMLYGIDPSPIPWVDYFKERLG